MAAGLDGGFGMNVISRETFADLKDTGDKLNILFDLITENHECSHRTEERMVLIEQKMLHKKIMDTAIAGFSGLGGGALAVLGLWFKGLWKPT